MINRFSPKETAVLKALARYKFLTYRQMVRLGIDKHITNLSTLMKGLKTVNRAYVKEIPKKVGVPMKHFLTNKGKNALIDLYGLDEEEIRLPKGAILTDTQDQAHRTSTISLQIELDFACQKEGLQLVFCDRYFDKTGNNRVSRNLKSKTAFLYTDRKTVKADLLFSFRTDKQEEFYTLELENGSDTQKGVEKCIEHAQALLRGSLNQKFGFERGYRSLWVFEREVIMNKTIERLQRIPLFENIREYFLFKTLDGVQENFLAGWQNVSARERNLYYID